MTVTLRGICVRAALMDRRTQLIRCASIKDATFDRTIQEIQELDDALSQLWDWKTIELKETL
jgi:uncharacterized protein YoxC